MQDTKRGLGSRSERAQIRSEVRPTSEHPGRTKIGPYQLITKIGEGGMGTVWLTKLQGPAGFNKLAVVKELRADLTGSPAFVEMFLNEARLAARLTHPNVVHTYGANDDAGRLYIAMEYLDGQPWSHVRHVLWSNRSLPLSLHLKVLADTLAGLHYAHELCDYDGTPLLVVHRDMSPQNTFVTYDGQVKVVDFGVARAVNSQPQEKAMFVGKLAYSAPEQLRGGALDRRADVFAVGVMLWEALAGRRLTEGQERSEAVRRRASEPAPPIRQVAPSVPRALADICDRALALDPADRHATAAEFREAILGYLAESSQVVDSAELGQLVANAFREERRKIQALIERHLMHSTPPPAPQQEMIDTLRPPPPADHHTIRADLSELASVSKLQDDEALREASGSASVRIEQPKRRLAVLSAAAAVVALAVVGFLMSRATPPPETVVASPLPVDPARRSAAAATPAADVAAGGAAVAPVTIELRVSADPPGSKLYLDGTPLPSNPYVGRVESDGELHLIRASAPGMHSQERVVALDHDRTLEFNLTPRSEPPEARARTRQAAPPRPTPQANRAARAPRDPAASPEPSAPATQPEPRPDGDFDMRIAPKAAPRDIYVEDPY